MSDTLNKINEDIKTAMKAKDPAKVSILRMVKAAAVNAVIAKKRELTEMEVISIVRKQISNIDETMEMALKDHCHGNLDLSDELTEIRILKEYLPAEISTERLEQVVRATIKENGFKPSKEIGQCIKLVKEKLGPSGDGKAISEAVKRLLV